MKELTFQAFIPGCSIQDFHAIACSDSRAITAFHREVNSDDSVAAGEWAGDTRVVEFTLAMSLPASVQRMVGAGPIRIRETQTLTWLDEATIKIVSVPDLQLTMGKAVSSVAELLIRGVPQGVAIDVAVQVSAAIPWPMQGTIEGLMVEQARRTVGQYVQYISSYVEAALEDMNNRRALQQGRHGQQSSGQAAGQEPHIEGPATPVEVPNSIVGPEAPAPIAEPSGAPAAAPPLVSAAVPAPAGAPRPSSSAAAPLVAAAPPPLPSPAPPAPEPADEFFEAHEAAPGSSLDLVLRELREQRAQRQETNRLLADIRQSLARLDHAVARELAFQEGVRYAQQQQQQQMAVASSSSSSTGATGTVGSGVSLLLSVGMAAAAASAVTMLVVARRQQR